MEARRFDQTYVDPPDPPDPRDSPGPQLFAVFAAPGFGLGPPRNVSM